MVKMRRFMVQTKKLEVMKYKELDPIILANLWTLCQISLTKLSCPIGKGYIWKLILLTGLTKVNITVRYLFKVGCELGRFYRKEAVIELLLDRNNLTGKFPPELHKKTMHIRNMKDVTVSFKIFGI